MEKAARRLGPSIASSIANIQPYYEGGAISSSPAGCDCMHFHRVEAQCSDTTPHFHQPLPFVLATSTHMGFSDGVICGN
jgi:hypothetical protein